MVSTRKQQKARERKKKICYLMNTGQYENYLIQKGEPKVVVVNKNITKTIMEPNKKLLLFLPADTIWGRSVRRGIVVAFLTFMFIILKDWIIPSSPEVWIAIGAGILSLIDKTIRELIAGSGQELAKQ